MRLLVALEVIGLLFLNARALAQPSTDAGASGPTPVPWRATLPAALHPKFKPVAKLSAAKKAAVGRASAAAKKAAAAATVMNLGVPGLLQSLKLEDARRDAGVDVMLGVP